LIRGHKHHAPSVARYRRSTTTRRVEDAQASRTSVPNSNVSLIHIQILISRLQLKDLLNLKQQQANVLEARSTRKQATATGEHGKTIMVFTIVTIISVSIHHVQTHYRNKLIGKASFNFHDYGLHFKHCRLSACYDSGNSELSRIYWLRQRLRIWLCK
jgi:hypothetical protein